MLPILSAEGLLAIEDYYVIVFYLLFMLSLGPIFKSFSKNASDFYRGGGNMTWWIAAASMFMTGFTAWTYTGAAGKIFKAGLFFLTLTIANFLSGLFTSIYTAHKFRQMRVITANEAIRNRFGAVNEQVNTWLPMPFNLLFGGIGLYTISMFMSCVFDVEIMPLIFILAFVIIVMTVFGGSWAATAGDFVQMIMLVSVSIAVLVLVLLRPDVGGVSGFLEKVSQRSDLISISEFSRWWIFIPYLATLILNQTILGNSLSSGAARFVFVKNGHEAKKISFIAMFAALPHTLIFIVPVLACALIYTPSQMQAAFPALTNPEEAAYVQIASQVLPHGLFGLMVCSIFAATLTSMNSGLNATSGIVIRNVYLPLINPQASDNRQVWIGRFVTLGIGLGYTLIAVLFSTLKTLPLYELILIAATSTGIPQAVPLFLGMYIRRAPDYAAWSTLAVGFATSIVLRFILTTENIASWTASYQLTGNEINDLNLALTTVILISVCTLWFLGCTLLAKRHHAAVDERVDKFFREMNSPVEESEHPNHIYNSDFRQFMVIGKLCLVYGLSVLALLAFDNTATGKFCIVSIGGLISLLGAWLLYTGRKRRNQRTVD